jgi:bacterioferritin-associated ferredoxin
MDTAKRRSTVLLPAARVPWRVSSESEGYFALCRPYPWLHAPSLDALDVHRQVGASARSMTMHGVARRSARRLDRLPRTIGNGSDCGKCSLTTTRCAPCARRLAESRRQLSSITSRKSPRIRRSDSSGTICKRCARPVTTARRHARVRGAREAVDTAYPPRGVKIATD